MKSSVRRCGPKTQKKRLQRFCKSASLTSRGAPNLGRPHRHEHMTLATPIAALRNHTGAPSGIVGHPPRLIATLPDRKLPNEATRIRSERNIIMESDHGKADECVCVGWKPAQGVVQPDAGECADFARTTLDEARQRRYRANAFLQ